MINTKEILKMAKAAVRHDQGYPERRLIHPYREWLIGLIFFTISLAAGCIAVGLVFLYYQNIEDTVTVEEQRIRTYQSGTVADVLALYSEREQIFAAVQTGAVVPPVSGAAAATSSASSTLGSSANSSAASTTNAEIDTELPIQPVATSTSAVEANAPIF